MQVSLESLRSIPLFCLLDDEELGVLQQQVEIKNFNARDRIYKIGEDGRAAYVVLSGQVNVVTLDEDHQEVVLDAPGLGGFFGFASLVDQTPHTTSATAMEVTVCIEIDRNDLQALIRTKPEAAMDIMATLGRQFHAAEKLVKSRTLRSPNEVIDEEETFGERISDSVARFGGSWRFIISFAIILVSYTLANILLGKSAWDPYPFILLNLFLSMLAAIQAPIIMMSQNRQDRKDRMRTELDFNVNRRSEMEIKEISKRLKIFEDHFDDIKCLLSNK